MPIRLNCLPIILSLLTIALLYPETILSQSVSDSQKKNFYNELFDIVPDTTDKSKVLVLGSKHLSRIDNDVEPDMLDSLLELLVEFDPSFIGVEKMSPDLIAAMELWGGGHEQVLEMMASRTMKLGGKLRQVHLLESPKVEQRITTYPQTGSNLVEKLRYEIADDAETGRVWINKAQYFDGILKVAWEFYIGGYQPAQKWLKDRKGRELSFEDILHYQKIVVALVETDRLMKEVDQLEIV